jgi:putative tryptophan/tyrosine transport system substrate-binding protein
MRRREFIAGLGSAATWPVVARAQRTDRMRRIGVITPGPSTISLFAFTQALAGLGWTDGRNVRKDVRLAGGDTNQNRALVQELIGLQPDILVTAGTPATIAALRETRTIPIVFANVGDPVASGIVARLDRPSENITGFANLEAPLGGKWLELLSEIAPGLKRAALMFNPYAAPRIGLDTSFEAAARSLNVVPLMAPVYNHVEIETAITALGREPGGGLVVSPDAFMLMHRAPVISAAARNKVPAVYAISNIAKDGGLLSYGFDLVDNFRRAASYVDRILRGEKAGDLPVQFQTKFELVINLKTAKALGLTIPETLLATADEVIQ